MVTGPFVGADIALVRGRAALPYRSGGARGTVVSAGHAARRPWPLLTGGETERRDTRRRDSLSRGGGVVQTERSSIDPRGRDRDGGLPSV